MFNNITITCHWRILLVLATMMHNVLHIRADDKTISLTNMKDASRSIQQLFEQKKRIGLADLTDDKDIMVRIHARWELCKGSKDKIKEFAKVINKEIAISPPEWWIDYLSSIKIEKDYHGLSGVASSSNKDFIYDHAGISYECNADTSGLPYKLTAKSKNKPLWTCDVWAVGRSEINGQGAHRLQIIANDTYVCIYGAESHGVYAEAFFIKDGLPFVRFCTCYWFNFPEKWKYAN